MDKEQKIIKRKLQEFAAEHGLRDSWHEPDEQMVSAIVTGVRLDNAYPPETISFQKVYDQELAVHLVVGDDAGNVVLSVNLADLFAIACG